MPIQLYKFVNGMPVRITNFDEVLKIYGEIYSPKMYLLKFLSIFEDPDELAYTYGNDLEALIQDITDDFDIFKTILKLSLFFRDLPVL